LGVKPARYRRIRRLPSILQNLLQHPARRGGPPRERKGKAVLPHHIWGNTALCLSSPQQPVDVVRQARLRRDSRWNWRSPGTGKVRSPI